MRLDVGRRPVEIWNRIVSWIAMAGLLLALLALTLAAVSGPGYRLDVWSYRSGFTLLRWAAYAGLAGGTLSLVVGAALVAVGKPRALWIPVLGLLMGAVAAYVPYSWRQKARSVPPIHDITTDLDSPPAFQAVLPLRAAAPNPAEHGGPEIAAQQRAAYPDLAPVLLDLPAARAFEHALAAARSMGWEIVAANEPGAGAGTIEATARTFWYGFEDDVIVRVTPVQGGTRIDVRSVSRVGRSDVGTNAQRIRDYLARLRTRAAS